MTKSSSSRFGLQKGEDMKVTYSKDVDILMVELSSEPIDFAERKGSVIVHFNKQREPVALEIMDAKQWLKRTYKALPRHVEREIIAAQ